MSWKSHFSYTLETDPQRLHFAAHSHHPWPDVSRAAQLAYWDDAAKHLDDKWDKIFSIVLPEARSHIATLLNISNPQQIQFFSSTHDFLARLLSCFDVPYKLNVLTTDSEFYSFERQMLRLEEEKGVQVTRVPTQPFATFKERFLKACNSQTYDLVFLSQVFFNSGWRVDFDGDWIQALNSVKGAAVVDGYHSFCAVPIDWQEMAQRVFFTAGGYKYAQVGEGACFAAIPEEFNKRPWNTGWMADFESLKSGLKTPVGYAPDASRFAGATFDATPIYRLNAVWKMWQENQVGVSDFHRYVLGLQTYFYSKIKKEVAKSELFNPSAWLLNPAEQPIGHFLTWRGDNAEVWHKRLREKRVFTDYRKNSLRFGFGIYQDKGDIDEFFRRARDC